VVQVYQSCGSRQQEVQRAGRGTEEEEFMEKRIEFVEAQSENSVSVRDWGGRRVSREQPGPGWHPGRPTPLRHSTVCLEGQPPSCAGVATGNQSASARRARFKAKWR